MFIHVSGHFDDSESRQILKHMKNGWHVNIVADAESGLYLCSSDIQPANFKKYDHGQLVALDFRATCFMPRSFMGVAMKKTQNHFCQLVARKITYPESDDVWLWSQPLIILFSLVKGHSVSATFHFYSPTWTDFYHCAVFPRGLERKTNFN